MSDLGLGVIVAGAIASTGRNPTTRRIGRIVANITIDERHHDEVEITDHPVELGGTVSDHVFKRPPDVTIQCAWSNSPSGGTNSILGDIRGSLLNKLAGSAQNAITGAAQKAIGGSALGNLAVSKFGNLVASGGAFRALTNTGTGRGTSLVNDIYQQLLELQIRAIPFDVYTGKRRYTNMLIKTLTVETDRKTENALVATLLCRQLIIVQTQVVSVSAAAGDQRNPERTAPYSDSGFRLLKPANPLSSESLRSAIVRALPGIDLAPTATFGIR